MVTATIDTAHEAKELFSLLRFIFWQEPNQDLLDNFLQADTIEPDNDIERGLNMMHDAVEDNKTRLEEYIEELSIEFTRLFIGPKKPAAVPFASFYLSEVKQLMSEVTIRVRKIYLDSGMAAKQLNSIPDDHIAMELEFMAWLAGEEEAALTRQDKNKALALQETRNSFLVDQVRPWASTFAQNIFDNTQDDFYKGAALVLKGVVG